MNMAVMGMPTIGDTVTVMPNMTTTRVIPATAGTTTPEW
jgi:hypothetical protein